MVWAGWRAVPRYTYILDTTRDLPVTDSVRRHIRKCRESGCTLSTVWDLDAFGSVFDATRERQGFGLRLAPEAFRTLATQLHDAGLAWMASARSTDGRTLSSQIVLSVPGGRGAYMWTAGTHPEHLSSGVSAWLMVEIAAEARRRGHTFWDLCGADYPSIARFKSELGGTLTHYFQIQSSPSSLERVALWVRSLASARS
jgi:GNAT superfamily N-acetyltransferase